MEICREWAVEVDQDRKRCNLEAQEKFILQFIGSLYTDIEAGHQQLSNIASLHFTRIFHPSRDNMGAYVRLRVFVDEVDLPGVEQEIDRRLSTTAKSGITFQVRKQNINWDQLGEEYGGPVLAPIFRDYLDAISRVAYQLLRKKQEGLNVENVPWPWIHFFFNAVRGYGRSVIEFAQGAVTGLWQNI